MGFKNWKREEDQKEKSIAHEDEKVHGQQCNKSYEFLFAASLSQYFLSRHINLCENREKKFARAFFGMVPLASVVTCTKHSAHS